MPRKLTDIRGPFVGLFREDWGEGNKWFALVDIDCAPTDTHHHNAHHFEPYDTLGVAVLSLLSALSIYHEREVREVLSQLDTILNGAGDEEEMEREAREGIGRAEVAKMEGRLPDAVAEAERAEETLRLVRERARGEAKEREGAQ